MTRFMSASVKIFPFLFATLFSLGACAGTLTTTDGAAELRLHTGLLSGESGEYVYDADGSASGIKGYKISELNWKLDQVPMIGIGASLPVGQKVRLNFDYWKNGGEGDSTMDDYDWLYVGYDWSHWSHHENTTVRDVTQMDFSADFNLHRFNSEKIQLIGILGYRQDHLDWQARGGHGIYSIYTYRDYYVTFPNVSVISYEQTFSTPYVGIGINSTSHSSGVDVNLSARLRYSQWAHGEDVDIHHLRDLRFEESGDGGEWLGVDLGMDFELTKQLSLMLGYNYQNYKEIKATTVITDLNTGVKTYYKGDAAGLDHASRMITLGLNYYF